MNRDWFPRIIDDMISGVADRLDVAHFATLAEGRARLAPINTPPLDLIH